MNAFINGEADAYAKRNAGHSSVEPWFVGMVLAADPRSIVDLGCGDAERLLHLRSHCIDCLGVDARSGANIHRPGLHLIYGQDVETYEIPACDMVSFNYVLHWLEKADEVIERAMKASKHLLIHDFFPAVPIDVAYAHAPGIVTRKRQYGTRCKAAGWELHSVMRYHYHNNPAAEWCSAEIWRKP